MILDCCLRTNEEIDSCFSEHELMQEISSIPSWHHSIKLGTKIVTPGKQPSEVEKLKINRGILRLIK